MPTRAETPTDSSHISLRTSLQELNHNWTDDLPVCHLSGVGVSTNQLYREDGQRREEHEFEDTSFHFKVDENTQLYGVFDGHDGSRASKFAAQRIPAELLLGQLNGRTSDAEIRETLEQAFVAVERGFFQSIDDQLAEKANLQMELPEGLSSYQTYQQYPHVVAKLQNLNTEIAGGTTAVVALIHNKRLYVANVGDSRALLCRVDGSGTIHVKQLTIDHDIHNEDERLRLKNLNLDVEKILLGSKIGNQDNTRCIGNYAVKGGYKDFDTLSSAREEPVIATPDIFVGIPIDSTFRFLILMSDGLYKSVEEAIGTSQVNCDIANMVMDQFAVQSTLMGVAQAVVDRVVRIHHDTYMSNPRRYQRRDDMTILIRNFHQPLPKSLGGSSSPNQTLMFPSLSVTVSDSVTPSVAALAPLSTTTGTTRASTASTADTVNSNSTLQTNRNSSRFVVDDDGYIEPYVDFSDFYRALEEARNQNTPQNGN